MTSNQVENTSHSHSNSCLPFLVCICGVLEQRLRGIMKINKIQRGITPGRGTTVAVFMVRQVQKRFSVISPVFVVFNQ